MLSGLSWRSHRESFQFTTIRLTFRLQSRRSVGRLAVDIAAVAAAMGWETIAGCVMSVLKVGVTVYRYRWQTQWKNVRMG